MFEISYRPLDQAGNEIRLLRISSRRESGSILACQIFHASLDDNIDYEALSYTWGDRESRGEIYFEDKITYVTTNLAQALSDIRYENEERILWADALCIDQGNIEERNHQVRKMSMIYHSAKRVLAWVGRPKDVDIKDAPSTITFLKNFQNISASNLTTEIARRLTLMPSIEASNWMRVTTLCELPYWHRLWIVQEIGLASELHIYHGTSSIDWREFASLQHVITTLCQWKMFRHSFRVILRTTLESRAGLLEYQNGYQVPFWLRNCHDEIREYIEIARRYESKADDLSASWRKKNGQTRHIDIASSKNRIPSISGVDRCILTPSRWLYGLFAILKELPLRLDHISISQHEESDNDFLERIASIKAWFTYGSRYWQLRSGEKVEMKILVGEPHPHSMLQEVCFRTTDRERSLYLYKNISRCLDLIPGFLKKHRERQKETFKLHNLLESCETSICQDQRDKVYGLLGIVWSPPGRQLPVDYSKPMFRIYEDVISYIYTEDAQKEDFNLPRFSQLIQRSLGGPFQCRNSELLTLPSFSVWLRGPILILELDNLNPTAPSHYEQRKCFLKEIFQGHTKRLDEYVSQVLEQLELADKETLAPLPVTQCYASRNASATHIPHQVCRKRENRSRNIHPKLFIEASGLIGLGPCNIREGDILCQFPACDIAAIIRPFEDHFKIIGRAVVARKFGEKEQRVSKYSRELFNYNVPDESLLADDRVYFHVDTATLQALTCPVSNKRRYDYSDLP